MEEKTIGINAAAELAGTTPRALRYLESVGLITPIYTDTGRRRYTQAMVKSVMSINEQRTKQQIRLKDMYTIKEWEREK